MVQFHRFDDLEYASETAICYSKTYTRTLVQDYNESLTAGYVAKARLLELLSTASDFHGLVPPRNLATTLNSVNTKLVTLAPGLRPERRFAPLDRG